MAQRVAKVESVRYNKAMVYTIGYAGLNIDRFLDILKENKISLLIDVRSLPKSKYFKDFNDNNLSKVLPKNANLYIFK